VWETLNEVGTPRAAAVRIMRVGLPDRFVTHGKPALLYEEVGFTGQRIAERVLLALGDASAAEQGSGSAVVGA
jgi:1-deoxy-D-xylulose-5-phosphate synthase